MVVKLRVTGPKLLTGYMLVFLGPEKVTNFKIVNSRVQLELINFKIVYSRARSRDLHDVTRDCS